MDTDKSDATWKKEIAAAKESPKLTERSTLSEFVSHVNGTDEEFLEVVENASKDAKLFKEQLRDPNSYMSKLINAAKNNTSQFEFMREAIIELNKTNTNLTKSIDGLTDKLTTGKKSSDKEAKGLDGKMRVIARTRGLKKIYLLNSGFHVWIRPFELAELNEIFNSIDIESKEFGRILGGHFHLIADVFIKQKFMELFPRCIVNSNLKNYKKEGVLAKAIKFQDYDTLLWGCCSLLFKEGINIELVCVNPECKHIESELYIDLENTRLNNFDKVPTGVIDSVIKGEEITLEELYKLQDEFEFNKQYELHGEIYHFKVPSMAEYLNNGLALIAKIIAAVNGETSIDDKKMQAQVTIYLYQTQLPWIDRIDFLNDDGEIDFFTIDKEVIATTIDTDREDKQDFYNELTKFVTDTKITHICYTAIKCPMCGKVPQNDLKDYFPVDVQLLFFYLCCRLLQLAGLNLTRT